MSPNAFVSLSLLVLQLWFHCCTAQYSTDQCSWKGSGLTQSSKDMLQVSLGCREGTFEWIYPKGRIQIRHEHTDEHRHVIMCIKPSTHWAGATMILEKEDMSLLKLVNDDYWENGTPQMFCFPRSSLYLEATSMGTMGTLSRQVASFQYELHQQHVPQYRGGQTECRPCSDQELLLAICDSHFVVRGYIKSISNDRRRQTSFVEVSGGRVYRQRSSTFEREEEEEEAMAAGSMGSRPGPGPPASPSSSSSWHGTVRALLQCGIKPGGGRFLFMGSQYFGEAWLGCAPRYKHFLHVYRKAQAAGQTSCDFPLD